jgi:hypothetical protein
MRFHATNDISQNFSGTTLGFREVLKYCVDFQFCFWYFQKMTPKFQFHSYRFENFQTLQMVKVQKVNIPDTYSDLSFGFSTRDRSSIYNTSFSP